MQPGTARVPTFELSFFGGARCGTSATGAATPERPRFLQLLWAHACVPQSRKEIHLLTHRLGLRRDIGQWRTSAADATILGQVVSQWRPIDAQTPNSGRNEPHLPPAFRLAFRLAGDEDLARDFTQEAFIRAFERLGDFRGESACGTWLHTIAVSVSLNGLRKVKRIHACETTLDHAESLGSTDRRADSDLRDRLHRSINALPEGYRTVFVLHDVEGYTHKEIGQMLGIQSVLEKVLARRDKCSTTLRRKAVFLVSPKGDARAAEILMNAVRNDPDSEVKEQALFSLGQTRDERAVDMLQEILQKETSDEVLDKAVFALSRDAAAAQRRARINLIWSADSVGTEHHHAARRIFRGTRVLNALAARGVPATAMQVLSDTADGAWTSLQVHLRIIYASPSHHLRIILASASHHPRSIFASPS